MNKTVKIGQSNNNQKKNQIKLTSSKLISSPTNPQPKTQRSYPHDQQSTLFLQSHTKPKKSLPIIYSQKQHLTLPINTDQQLHNTQYNNLTREQLINLIQLYKQRILQLKNYLHNCDLLQHQKIISIFGLNYNCCPNPNQQQYKLILQQLTKKIKKLVKQNHQLKQKTQPNPILATPKSKSNLFNNKISHDYTEGNQYICYSPDDCDDITTLKQQISTLKQQISTLKLENQQLNQIIKVYKNKIQALQHQQQLNYFTPYKQSPYKANNQAKQPPLFQPKNSSFPPHPQTTNSQKQQQKQQPYFLSSQQNILSHNNNKQNIIFQLDPQITIMSQKHQQSLDKLGQKMKYLQNQLRQHLKLKQDNILYPTSTISQFNNNLITKNKQILTDNSNSNQLFYQQQYPYQQNYHKQLAILKQKLSIYQLQKANNIQQINLLKQKQNKIAIKYQQQITNNNNLSNIINQLQQKLYKYKNTNKNNQYDMTFMKQQLNIIKSSLNQCQIYNQSLFKQYTETLQQRNQFASTLSSLNNYNHQQNGTQNHILLSKINQLSQQNKLLQNKISQLQPQLTSYDSPNNNSPIKQLHEINISQMAYPTEQDAQKVKNEIKNKFETNINSLTKLQNKIGTIYQLKNRKTNASYY